MSDQTLHEAVRQLHSAMDHADEMDPELRSELLGIAEEIQEALGGEEPPFAALKDRLADLLLDLEAEHPLLTEAVERMVRQLGGMGI